MATVEDRLRESNAQSFARFVSEFQAIERLPEPERRFKHVRSYELPLDLNDACLSRELKLYARDYDFEADCTCEHEECSEDCHTPLTQVQLRIAFVLWLERHIESMMTDFRWYEGKDRKFSECLQEAGAILNVIHGEHNSAA